MPCIDITCDSTEFEKVVAVARTICNDHSLKVLEAEGVSPDDLLRFIYCKKCGKIQGHTIIIKSNEVQEL